MPKGGSRNRSGPQADPSSGRSERRGYTVTALPAEGYDGPVPPWPLGGYMGDDDGAAAARAAREVEVWRQAWRTPQACAWSMPTEAWRLPTVALWVRLRVRCEDPEAPASLLAQLHRFADQIGMTTAGLAEMGWKIAAEQPAAPAAGETPQGASEAPRGRRLRAVGDGQ